MVAEKAGGRVPETTSGETERISHPTRQVAMHSRDSTPTPPTSGERAANAPKARVLIVDDEEGIQKALHRLLSAEFDVTTVGDGSSAADLLTHEAFDVVLSDIRLPKMSGVDLLRVVRSYDLDVPVILMTGLPTIETAMAAVDLGALTYITKPFDSDALLAALRRAERLSRLARAKRDALAAGVGSPLAGDRAGLEASFDNALETLWIAFQPIVDARTKRTFAYEALMRTDEPSMPHPGVVLEAAERLDRLHSLGRRVRERVAESFRPASSDAVLFVNLHSADLEDEQLYDKAAPLAALAHRVVFEITERASLDKVADVRKLTTSLRAQGYRIALDDIGAGYSGLASFATLEPEIVKLDMSLVRDIENSPVRFRIVDSITTLCRELSIKVVAEGVETSRELGRLLDLKCDYLQGFYFGRPARDAVDAGRTW
jgi:EAL domain-containing protein (putative c-di-GMP-specific phosphodiesterase class I)